MSQRDTDPCLNSQYPYPIQSVTCPTFSSWEGTKYDVTIIAISKGAGLERQKYYGVNSKS